MSVVADTHALDLISHSADQTRRLGAHLGTLVEAGDIVCLEGDLGVGKTCFAQGLGRGMGIEESITSPTFTLVNEYPIPGRALRLYHIDLYRLGDVVPEALAIGLDDYLYGDGVCVIEWADRAGMLLPPDRLTVQMRAIDPYKRGLLLRAGGERAQRLVGAFRDQVFGAPTGSSA